jgi:multiple antibiotic resistance protein
VWHEIIIEAVTLFVVIDPIGSASIFLSLVSERTPAERRRIARRSVLFATGILVAFIVAGKVLLGAMDVSITAFQIAGGIVLFVFGLNMIFEFTSDPRPVGEAGGKDISAYPLAVPVIAGPGAMMAVVLLSDDDRNYLWKQGVTMLVLLAIMVVTYLLFLLALALRRFIADSGVSIVKRVMGLLLCTVAIDTALTGVADFFKEVSR